MLLTGGLQTGSGGDFSDGASGGITIRLLRVGESARLGDAIRRAYGTTYDAPWVYDAHEVAIRIADGRLTSCIAETVEGELLCHAALSVRSPQDPVGHAGQAVTLPLARGHHLFTRVKRELAEIARRRGLLGMYSEVTAVHPYSQKANVELGAQETGFLLGWIPGSVENDAASGRSGRAPLDPGPRQASSGLFSRDATAGAVTAGDAAAGDAAASARQSAALFYLRTNAGRDRPVYVPERHREIVHQTIRICRFHGRLADPPRRARIDARSTVHTAVDLPHNMAVLTVTEPGSDLAASVSAIRERLFRGGLDALYLDLPLDHHATALLTEEVEHLGVSYAGVFPNSHRLGDVLRLQVLNGLTVRAADVVVASEHGRSLLAYVLSDLEATGHRVER